MEIKELVVPAGIRYISDWKEYNLSNFPFPHILDKVLTGCGYTESVILNQQDVILCSPRRMLLENKEDQHPGEVFYARNEILDSIEFDRVFTEQEMKKRIRIDQLLKKKKVDLEQKKKETLERVLKLKNSVISYYRNQKLIGKPVKIIVTYDSFLYVKEALAALGVLGDFQIVIDEFQSILVDAKFKSEAEIGLLYQLQDLQKICFVSATPMMEQYLEELDEFKDLPYYRLDWKTEDPGRIINPNLGIHKTYNILKDISDIIEDYKLGKFAVEAWIDDQGMIQEIKSTEAVFYVNSVAMICQTIKRCKLLPEECNILCAKTDENEKKVRKAFNDVIKTIDGMPRISSKTPVIGSIPKRGESHKMFTFCTRTVYLGADFYSECARTFIFSDSNIDCLSVDISLDLPQILGRQRLDINPWKNHAELYVKNTILELTKEDFDHELERKIKKTNNLLLSYSTSPTLDSKHDLADTFQKVAKSFNYKDDYVSVNTHAGSDLKPVFNNLMLVSEKRTFDIQQLDYKDRVSVLNTLRDKGFVALDVDSELYHFNNNLSFFHDRMRYVCELGDQLSSVRFDLFLNSIPKDYKNYYTVLGPGGCSACSFKHGELEKEYQRRVGNQGIDINSEIEKLFSVGSKYTKSSIKDCLANLYKTLGYNKTAKASDLEEYFELKPCLVSNKETGKRDAGFEIVSRK